MTDRIIFHIDVNSAFLSWSAVKMMNEGSTVDIRTVAAIIGGDEKTRHGIVLAKSIPAAKCKIKTGEPVAGALKKCPGLLVVPPNRNYYNEQSRKFIELLHEYTPDIEQVSIDECYLDFTGIRNQFESPVKAAEIIKDRIYKELGFTVNVGISDRKILAKMASDFEKPNKVHTLYKEEIAEKMWPLDAGDLFMVGKSSADVLKKLGIRTIGDIAAIEPEILELHLKKHGRMIWEYANGIDDSWVNVEETEVKGVGNSTTVSKDVTDAEEANKVLLKLAESVSSRLRKQGRKAQVVCVEVKYNDFTKVSHQKILNEGVNSCEGIYEAAKELLEAMWDGKPVRLLGVRTTKLCDENEPVQMNLFEMLDNKKSCEEKLEKVNTAIDQLKIKYGNDIVNRGSLLK